jgi:hypothetical protein
MPMPFQVPFTGRLRLSLTTRHLHWVRGQLELIFNISNGIPYESLFHLRDGGGGVRVLACALPNATLLAGFGATPAAPSAFVCSFVLRRSCDKSYNSVAPAMEAAVPSTTPRWCCVTGTDARGAACPPTAPAMRGPSSAQPEEHTMRRTRNDCAEVVNASEWNGVA